MAPPTEYSATLAAEVAEYLVSLPRQRQRRLLRRLRELARDPFQISDYIIRDAAGHDIEHLHVDGFLLAYWVDHAARLVMIVDVEALD